MKTKNIYFHLNTNFCTCRHNEIIDTGIEINTWNKLSRDEQDSICEEHYQERLVDLIEGYMSDVPMDGVHYG